jgi:PAS domain S-box-containing protein
MVKKHSPEEANMQLVIDALPHFVCLCDGDGLVQFINKTGSGYFSKQPAKLDFSWTQRVHPEERFDVQEQWSQAQKPPKIIEALCRFQVDVKDANEFRWHLVRAVPMGSQWIVSATDVHNHKLLEDGKHDELKGQHVNTEQQLLHFQQLLWSLLNNMPALAFIKDDKGQYLYASKSFCQFFAVSPEKFLTKTDFEWLPQDIAQQFVSNDDLVRQSLKPVAVVERVPTDKGIVESIVQKFPIHGGTDVPFVGGVAIDITAVRQSEERARLLSEDLQSLAYAVSHELQEPVRTIKSYHSLLAARYADRLGPDADNFIQECHRAATTVEKMIDGLWTYARICRREDFADFDSAKALGTALNSLQAEIDGAGAHVEYGDMPKVRAIEEQIAEVFTQIIRNALQFRGDEPPHIKISATARDRFQRFCIEDNGPGINPVLASETFRLFRRLTSKPDATGTGMGLAICRRILEHNGGNIWIESAPDSGTKFFFELPSH